MTENQWANTHNQRTIKEQKESEQQVKKNDVSKKKIQKQNLMQQKNENTHRLNNQ